MPLAEWENLTCLINVSPFPQKEGEKFYCYVSSGEALRGSWKKYWALASFLPPLLPSWAPHLKEHIQKEMGEPKKLSSYQRNQIRCCRAPWVHLYLRNSNGSSNLCRNHSLNHTSCSILIHPMLNYVSRPCTEQFCGICNTVESRIKC